MKKSIFLSFFIVIILITYPGYASAEPANLMIGKTSPSFVLPDIKGRQHSIDQWKNKFIVLNFWATWCTPCKKEIPLFNEFQKTFSDDVQFIGIAIDNRNDVKKFLQKIPITYPNLIGGLNASNLILSYGNKAGVLPYTVFINRSGKIVMIASGEITRRFLLNTLEKHL